MSMDTVHRELKRFNRDLERFTGAVRSSVASLEREHQAVDALWRDSFRKNYDRRWAEFGKHMDRYLGRDAVRYSQFLAQKIKQVESYLDG